MAEAIWTSPALEFYQKHSIGPLPSPVLFSPDLLMRWQPILTGVDESRREELVSFLEFESRLVLTIIGSPALVGSFEAFLRAEKRDWLGEAHDDNERNVLGFYHQAVKRKVLEQKERHFVLPSASASEVREAMDKAPAATPPSDNKEMAALELAYKTQLDAWKKSCESLKVEIEAQRRMHTTEIEKERQRVDDFRSKWSRSAAEFENYQKRVKRDQEREREAGLRRILADLVIVIDNASLAVENANKPETTTAMIVQALSSSVRGELLATLSRHGGKPMGVKVGDVFDPARHEAVSVAVEEGSPERDEVVTVVREGYLLGTAILRTASVIVKRIKAPKPPEVVAEAPAEAKPEPTPGTPQAT